jgi:hypothetical protein
MFTFPFTTFTKVIDAAKKFAEGTFANSGSSSLGTGLRWVSQENEGVTGFFGDSVVAAKASNNRRIGQYENSRSNAFTYNQQFEHTNWFKESGSVTSSVITAPDGTFSADKFIETDDAVAENVLHFITQSFAPDGFSTYAYSVYAKYSGSNRNLILSSSSGSVNSGAFSGSVQISYNLERGIINTVSGTPSQIGIEGVGDGWYRCWYSVTSSCTSSADFSICLSSGSSAEYNYEGDGTGGIYIWNAQLEVGAFPSSPLPSGDNLFTFCRDFTENDWDKTRSGISGNLAIAPDGTLTADKLVEDSTAANTHYISDNIVPDGVSSYCLSIYAKAAERTFIKLQLSTQGFAANANAVFDLGLGTISDTGAGAENFGMDSVGNGWYHCWIAATSDAAASTPFAFFLAIVGGGSVTYSGDGASGLYIWNAQLEPTTKPGPPIFTEATNVSGSGPVTRNKDTFYWGDQASGSLSYLRDKFAFKYRPEFNSDTPHSAAYIWDFQDSLGEYNTRAFLDNNNYFKIEDQDNNEFVTINSESLSWSRGGELEFICEPLSGTVELRGFLSGNGIYQGDPWSPRDGNINWGGTSKPVDGVMTEPYNLKSKYELADFGTGNYSNNGPNISRWFSSPSSIAGLVGAVASGSHNGRTFGQFEYGAANLLSQSQAFSRSEWTNSNTGVSGNLVTAPDGTLTADKLVEHTTVASGHYIQQSPYVDGSSTYCFSVYAKAQERTWFRLLFATAGYPSNSYGYFDIGNGTVGTAGGGIDDSGIENIGNGWYRCWITATSDAADGTAHRIHLAEADEDITYNGDGASGLYLWNAQLEVGNYPSSPILTGQNKLAYSEQFDIGGAANWVNVRAYEVANNTIAPNGTLTADKTIEDKWPSNTHYISQTTGSDGSSQYWFSVYAKAAERTWLRLLISSVGFPAGANANFNLSSGTLGLTGSGTDDSGIENVGNGWYRCWIAATSDLATGSNGYRFDMIDADIAGSSYSGDGASGIYLWGAQLEIGSDLGSYVPSETTEVITPLPRYNDVFYWDDREISPQMRKKHMLQFVPNYSKSTMTQSLSTLWEYKEFGDNIGFKAQLSSSGELFVSSAGIASTDSYVSVSNLDWDRGNTLTAIFDPDEGMIKTIGFGTGSQTVWEEPWFTLSGTLYWGMSSSQETQINGLMTKPLQAPAYPHYVYLDEMVGSSSVERYLSVSGAGILRPYNTYGQSELATVTLNDFIFVQSEMSSANGFTKAQQFGDSDWSKTRCGVSGNFITAPDGTLTADKLVEDSTAANTHYLQQNVTPDGISPYVFSVYAKAGERNWMTLVMHTAGFPGQHTVSYNLTTGVVGTEAGSPDDSGIENVGNGWYRCWVVGISDALAATAFRIHLAEADNDVTFDGDGASGLYIWNAQVEISKFPTSPIHGGENVLSYSRDLTDNIWEQIRSGISGNIETAPDGTLTADKLVEDGTAGNTHSINQPFIPDGSSTYCASCYAKAGERTWILLVTDTAGFPNAINVYYDLSTGTIGTEVGSPDATGIEDVGNGWYRCWFTVTSDSASTTEFTLYLAEADNDVVYDGDAASGAYFWNAQIEKTDAAPGPPIKTEDPPIVEAILSRSITKISTSAGSFGRNTLRNQFQVKFIPYFDHDAYNSSSQDPRIISWYDPVSTYLLELYYSSSLAKFMVASTGPADLTRVSSSAVTFNRGQELTFTLNPDNEMLALSGCLTGNGNYFGTGSWVNFLDDGVADMYLGSQGPGFVSQSNGLVSLPIITNTPITEKLTMVTSANPFALWHSEYGLVLAANRVTGWDDQWGYVPAVQTGSQFQPFYNSSTKRVEFNSSSGEWLSITTMSGSPDNWSLVAGLDVRDAVGQYDHLFAAENIKFNILGLTASRPGYWTPEAGDRQPTNEYTTTSSQTMAFVLRTSASDVSQIRRNGCSLSGSYHYSVSHSMAGESSGIGAYSGSQAAGMHLRFLALYQGALSPGDLGYVENLALQEMGQKPSVANKLAQVTSVEPISLWHAKYGVCTGSVGNVEYWFDQWGGHHGYQPNIKTRPSIDRTNNVVLFNAYTRDTMPLDFTASEPSGSYWFVFGIQDTLSGNRDNEDQGRYFGTESEEISLYRSITGSLAYSSSLVPQAASSSANLTGSHVVSFLCNQGSSQGKFRANGQKTGDFTYSLASIDGSASLGSIPGFWLTSDGRGLGRHFDGGIKFAAIYRGEPSSKDQAYIEKIALDEMQTNETSVIVPFEAATYTNPQPRYMSVVSGGVTGEYEPSVPATRYLNEGRLFYQSELAVRNFLSHSQDFDHADWSKTRSGISASMSASVVVAPDGLATVDKFVEDSTAANSHYIRQLFISADSVSHCFSIYAKAAERTWLRLDLPTDGGFNEGYCYYDLANGAVGTTSNIDNAGIENVGNGWYRCWMTSTSTGAALSEFRMYLAEGDGDITIDGDGASGLYFWNAQAEASNFPSSPIHSGENTVRYSHDVTQTGVWVKSNVGMSSSLIVAPDGTFSATKVVDNQSSGWHYYRQTISPNPDGSSVYCLSVYAKAVEHNWLSLRFDTAGFNNERVYYDLSDGTLGATVIGSPVGYGITDAGNGWYRCWMAATSDASSTTLFNIAIAEANGDLSFTGNGMDGLYVWGHQLERSSFPGKLLLTVDTSSTGSHYRDKDQLNWAADDVPMELRGKFAIDIIPYWAYDKNNSGTPYIINFNASADSPRIAVYYNGATDKFTVQDVTNTVALVLTDAVTFSAHQKITLIIDPPNGKLTVSGCTTGDGTYFGTPWKTTQGIVRFGMTLGAGSQFDGFISEPYKPSDDGRD